MHPDKLKGLNRRQLAALAVRIGHRQDWADQQSEVYLRKLLMDAKDPDAAAPAPAAPAAKAAPLVVNMDDAIAARITEKVKPAVQDALTSPLLTAARKAAREEAAMYARENFIMLPAVGSKPPEVVNMGLMHMTSDQLLEMVYADIPAYIYGPSGSGKSHAGEQVAAILSASTGKKFEYHFQSFCESTQLHELIGYRDAVGNVHRTPLREAWEHGGVWLGDEMDAAPAVLVYLNAALSNGWCLFPDGKIKKHADCRIIAAGNTVGLGATAEYTGRQRLDRAVIARFGFLRWDYDEKLELAISGADQEKWVKHVQKLRKAHKSLGASAPDIAITPRASIYGARLLRLNPSISFETLEQRFVWQGAEEDDILKVRSAAAKMGGGVW